jgi:hypothetical protein
VVSDVKHLLLLFRNCTYVCDGNRGNGQLTAGVLVLCLLSCLLSHCPAGAYMLMIPEILN